MQSILENGSSSNENAEIAQLVEHNLAKVGVASSSLVFRSKEVIRNGDLFCCSLETTVPADLESAGTVNYCCWSEFSTFFATIASMTATAVMFTMSRTELSISVKCIGLFSPIWIGPIISASLIA